MDSVYLSIFGQYWNIDFTKEDKPSYLTFTRASSGTYTNSLGIRATAGTDTLRFDHNPSTLTALGLLVEPASTNLSLNSEDASTFTLSGINAFGSGSVVNAAVAPDGNATADFAQENTANSVHQLYTLTVASASPLVTSTFSIFVKPAGRSFVSLSIQDRDNGANRVWANFNLTTGSVISTNNNGTASGGLAYITALKNGWFRVSVSGIPGSGTALRVNVYVNASSSDGVSSYTGDGTSGLYLWGSQVEQGAISSYIPTSEASATRAFDTPQISNLSSIRFNPSEGTLFADFILNSVNGNQWVAQFDEGSSLNRVAIRVSSGVLAAIVSVGGSTTTLTLDAAVTAGIRYKVAFGFKNHNFVASVNGGTPVSNSYPTMPVGLTTMRIGTSVATAYLNGTIAMLRYYPTALSNSQIQALTQ